LTVLILAKDSFEIRTSFDKGNARQILEEKVAKGEGFSLFGVNVFAGRVDQDSFEIDESWGFFRLLNPTFYGSFKETDEGTMIKVKASVGLARQNHITYWAVSGATLIVATSRLFYHDYRGVGAFLALSALSACFAIGIGRIYDERLTVGREKLISLFESAEKKDRGAHREELQKRFLDRLDEPTGGEP